MSDADFAPVLPELRPLYGALSPFDLYGDLNVVVRPILVSIAEAQGDPDASVSTKEQKTIGGVKCWVYSPPGGKSKGTVIGVHGGGNLFGDARADQTLYVEFVKNGYTVVSPDYRLAPEHQFPAPFDDVESVYDALDGDISLWGSSAGAWIASGVTIRLKKKGKKLPKIVLLDSPWTDHRMTSAAEREDNPLAKYFIWLTENTKRAVELTYGGKGPNSESTPILDKDPELFKNLPPHVIVACQIDCLVDMAFDLFERLKSAGNSVDFHYYSGAYHAFSTLMPAASISVGYRNALVTALNNAHA